MLHLCCLLYVTDRTSSDQNPSVIQEVPAFGLSAWNIQQITDKKNTLKKTKQNDNKKQTNIIIMKTFFLVWNQIQNVQHWENSTEETFASVKIKPLFLIWSCSLSIQTLDSVPMHVSFFRAPWHTTMP